MSSDILLTIMIPTYNRSDFLARNIEMLQQYIQCCSLENHIEILVSDNASVDNTKQAVNEAKKRHPQIIISNFHHETNMGMIKNYEFIIANSSGKYIMYLGDDDFLAEEYFKAVIEKIKDDPNITSVIPSYKNIDIQGNDIGRNREAGRMNKVFQAGFYNTFCNSWKGHQLSGLVFRRDIVLNTRQTCPIENLYPFILDAVATTHLGSCFLCTQYPVLVTRPPQNKKAWGYGEDGLLNQVFENYRCYPNYNGFQKGLLQLKFLDAQYWRFAMYLKKGPLAFLKCLWKIESAPNTVLLTRIVFPVFWLLVLLKKTLVFLFTGKLFRTLRTKVDF